MDSAGLASALFENACQGLNTFIQSQRANNETSSTDLIDSFKSILQEELKGVSEKVIQNSKDSTSDIESWKAILQEELNSISDKTVQSFEKQKECNELLKRNKSNSQIEKLEEIAEVDSSSQNCSNSSKASKIPKSRQNKNCFKPSAVKKRGKKQAVATFNDAELDQTNLNNENPTSLIRNQINVQAEIPEESVTINLSESNVNLDNKKEEKENHKIIQRETNINTINKDDNVNKICESRFKIASLVLSADKNTTKLSKDQDRQLLDDSSVFTIPANSIEGEELVFISENKNISSNKKIDSKSHFKTQEQIKPLNSQHELIMKNMLTHEQCELLEAIGSSNNDEFSCLLRYNTHLINDMVKNRIKANIVKPKVQGGFSKSKCFNTLKNVHANPKPNICIQKIKQKEIYEQNKKCKKYLTMLVHRTNKRIADDIFFCNKQEYKYLIKYLEDMID